MTERSIASLVEEMRALGVDVTGPYAPTVQLIAKLKEVIAERDEARATVRMFVRQQERYGPSPSDEGGGHGSEGRKAWNEAVERTTRRMWVAERNLTDRLAAALAEMGEPCDCNIRPDDDVHHGTCTVWDYRAALVAWRAARTTKDTE